METLKEMLIRHEGMVLTPYRDSVGKLTIGVGRNLDDRGISEREAMILLGADIDIAIADAQQWLGTISFAQLDDPRKMVVANMAFNLGHSRLRGFKKLYAAIKDSNWQMAAIEMLDSKWARQVGRRAQELAMVMKTGRLQR